MKNVNPKKEVMKKDRPSDVIIFLTDQWNPRMLGCAGDRVIQTPNVDRLAAEGTRFPNSYSTSPVCMPARCALASGRYPHNTGLWWNMTRYCFPAHHLSIFRQMKDAGYSTAQIGKYHYSDLHSLTEGQLHIRPDNWLSDIALDHPQELPSPYATPWKQTEYSEHLKCKGLLRPYLDDLRHRFVTGDFRVVGPAPIPPEDHPDAYIARQAIEYINRHPPDQPMFLIVSLPGPHSPFDAPGEYADMFRPEDMRLAPNVPETVKGCDRDHIRRTQANYYGKIKLLDDWIGRLIDAQRARGKWNNTLAVFTADHGEYMGSHGNFGKCGFWEESAGIPLIVRWPGHSTGKMPVPHPSAGDADGIIQRGNTVDALVELIDVYATVIDAAGGKPARDTFGRSLMPFMRNPDAPFRDVAVSEIGHRGHLNYMVRDPRCKWFVSGGREHLFDLHNDPFEMTDLIDDPQHKDTADRLKDRLRQHLMQTQINDAATYQSLFERIGKLTSMDRLDEFLEQRFEAIHFEDNP
ncbi:MAG: sulfatase-like hydrolase/transferase [Candidatus Pacebacteria bacterium]|nr:sulfatase-like hydrolase/transferase [Candidatus Paceibacterota bacterium]